MKCLFCKSKCRLSHKENEDRENKNKYVSVYDCINCPVLTSFFINNEDNVHIKTVFMFDRNEKLYLWTDHHQNKYSYISDAGMSVASNGKDPLILKFPKLMNANPSNVKDKFKFYMIFS